MENHVRATQNPSTAGGPYDGGYESCPCFWGREPAEYVRRLTQLLPTLRGKHALDVGCGEGKNASYVHSLGAQVTALDVSEIAIKKASILWPNSSRIIWHHAHADRFSYGRDCYDIVICTGLLHCLPSMSSITRLICRLRRATRPGGYHVVYSFNNGPHCLSGHPELFAPFLPAHAALLSLYRRDLVIANSNVVQHDCHPDRNIQHYHSISRLLVQIKK